MLIVICNFVCLFVVVVVFLLLLLFRLFVVAFFFGGGGGGSLQNVFSLKCSYKNATRVSN